MIRLEMGLGLGYSNSYNRFGCNVEMMTLMLKMNVKYMMTVQLRLLCKFRMREIDIFRSEIVESLDTHSEGMCF